ncbi:DMT family transporter [Frankia sp. CN7]|uniref:DMT family transporter n=1 Tax=Frankia nepalensis TaxID=1836974 RepID=UPI001934435C|nr:DMT family transporter [Frankia nepalensis]MBL7494736.1 DMT family transporter [Frankia nepalensis]
MLTVIALSLAAAFLLASSAVLQQRAAVRLAGAGSPAVLRAVPGMGLLLALVRDPWWLAGWLANVCGFAVQAAALHLGSLAVVQPLVVTQLLFALALGTVGSGRRLPACAWWAAGAVCAGLALLLTVRGHAPTSVRLHDARLVAMIVVLVAAAGLLAAAAAALGRRPAARAALFGVAAGCFFALTAVLTKSAAGVLVDRGAFAAATSWYCYALAGSTLGSLLLGQTAFAAGPFAAAVTGMSITNPVVSYLLAVLVYGVPAPSGAGQLAGVLLARALVAAGGAGLAPMLSPPRAEDPPSRRAEIRASRRAEAQASRRIST